MALKKANSFFLSKGYLGCIKTNKVDYSIKALILSIENNYLLGRLLHDCKELNLQANSLILTSSNNCVLLDVAHSSDLDLDALKNYVFFSRYEFDKNNGAGFWNGNNNKFSVLSEATIYTQYQKDNFLEIPESSENDACLISIASAGQI